jgi:hypothetical protein
MDALKNAFGGGNKDNTQNTNAGSNEGGGLMGKLNNTMGGGQSGERNEDGLDKAVDYVQQRMGGGDQSNESAMEQAKDEQISDAIRNQYKTATGSDFPIADK